MSTLITVTFFAIVILALKVFIRKHGEESEKGGRAQLGLFFLAAISTSVAAWIDFSGREKIIVIVEVLGDDVDLHLGDNVYPDRYGFSHNPLHTDIYKQGVKGIVYFDKKTKTFCRMTTAPQSSAKHW